MVSVLAIVFAATFAVQPLPQEDGPLEMSVQNEVDRAIELGEAWLAAHPGTNTVTGDVFGTNGLSRAAAAVRLVSLQRAEGWWTTPTNAAPTRLAVDILKGF